MASQILDRVSPELARGSDQIAHLRQCVTRWRRRSIARLEYRLIVSHDGTAERQTVTGCAERQRHIELSALDEGSQVEIEPTAGAEDFAALDDDLRARVGRAGILKHIPLRPELS